MEFYELEYIKPSTNKAIKKIYFQKEQATLEIDIYNIASYKLTRVCVKDNEITREILHNSLKE